MKLSQHQQRVYDLHQDFLDSRGRLPTVRELMQLTGHKSTATVWKHIQKIQKSGKQIGTKGGLDTGLSPNIYTLAKRIEKALCAGVIQQTDIDRLNRNIKEKLES